MFRKKKCVVVVGDKREKNDIFLGIKYFILNSVKKIKIVPQNPPKILFSTPGGRKFNYIPL